MTLHTWEFYFIKIRKRKLLSTKVNSKKFPDKKLNHKTENHYLRRFAGQLNWLASQTRPDLAYDAFILSTCLNKATYAQTPANRVFRSQFKYQIVHLLKKSSDYNFKHDMLSDFCFKFEFDFQQSFKKVSILISIEFYDKNLMSIMITISLMSVNRKSITITIIKNLFDSNQLIEKT